MFGHPDASDQVFGAHGRDLFAGSRSFAIVRVNYALANLEADARIQMCCVSLLATDGAKFGGRLNHGTSIWKGS